VPCRPVQIEARVFQQSLVPELVRLGPIESGLIRPQVDLDQDVAGVDLLAFGKWIFMTCPSTRDLASTLLSACTVPSPVRKIGRSACRSSSVRK
jgi:hypothetical protein